MQFIVRHRLYYYIFTAIFFVLWFLFKVGGMIDIKQSLLSAAIDVAISLATLLITVKVLLPKLVYRHKYGLFTAFYLLLLVACGTVVILSQLWLQGSSILEYRSNVARSPTHYFYWFWADLIFGSYFLVFFISAAGAAIKFAFDRVLAINAVEKLQNEKTNAELDLLKNQVNPHFLFNALNTIFYKIDRNNQPARETLERFSKMLRYQLYECTGDFIAIEKELNFLTSYIELQKERLNENYRVTCKGFDDIKGLVISPFLLMPVIENCFKHVSRDALEENTIFIECTAKENIFTMQTRNTIDALPAAQSGGIGLLNMQKRLQLVYPGRHTFEVNKGGESYTVLVKIVLA